MTKRTFCFTLRDDMLSILSLVERRTPLTYRPVRRYHNSKISAYAAGTELPELGVATAGHREDETRYFVMAADEELKLDVVKLDTGGRSRVPGWWTTSMSHRRWT